MAVREKVNFVIDKNKTQFDVNLNKSLNFYLHKCSNDTWQVFNMIVSTFKRHGAETIDTPVFELKEVTKEKSMLVEECRIADHTWDMNISFVIAPRQYWWRR